MEWQEDWDNDSVYTATTIATARWRGERVVVTPKGSVAFRASRKAQEMDGLRLKRECQFEAEPCCQMLGEQASGIHFRSMRKICQTTRWLLQQISSISQ